MLIIETCFVLLSLLIAFVRPTLGSRWFEKVEMRFWQLSRHRVLSIVCVGVVALVMRGALLPIEPIPQPTIPDEFGYLLLSDTFAHGRLTNATHPMWVHLEAPAANQQPTYGSKYFPGPGVPLAFGQVVLGHPFWGVWLSAGIMCAVICWMLQGWFPPFWALLGALLALIRLGAFSYWANSYFGGALPAIGGALVLGALPRIKRRQRVGDSLLMGLGLALLASSRPFEGLIFSLPIVIALLIWIWDRDRSDAMRIATRVLIPSALILTLAFTAMFYYFWRTTGSPFRTPYQVNLQTWDPVPIFPWQSLRAVPRTEVGAVFFGVEVEQYKFVRSHFVVSSITRIIEFYLFFVGPALTLPFVLLAARTKQRKVCARLFLIVFLVSAFGLLLPVFYGPTYAAPLTCIVYVLLLAAMQRIRRWKWRSKSTGLTVVRAVPLICVLMFLIRAAASFPGLPMPRTVPITWFSPHLFAGSSRQRVQTALESLPGLQLALVRYPHDHLEPVDWVQNLADIDHQKVVWANDMGVERNQELIDYFNDRHVWLVEPDKIPPQVSPYPR
ncbi:MAG: hypothetical protein ACRD20_04610 [Terriglobales bacterium]